MTAAAIELDIYSETRSLATLVRKSRKELHHCLMELAVRRVVL